MRTAKKQKSVGLNCKKSVFARAAHFAVAVATRPKTVGFILKISKEIGKEWRKSLTCAKLSSLTRP